MNFFECLSSLIVHKKRYNRLLLEIEKSQPKTILEVGTWTGKLACQMVRRT